MQCPGHLVDFIVGKDVNTLDPSLLVKAKGGKGQRIAMFVGCLLCKGYLAIVSVTGVRMKRTRRWQLSNVKFTTLLSCWE